MTTRSSKPEQTIQPIYPARYFDASPTWYAWNKLTAADIHALREERGFESQHVYFHLNHPIRFVRVVGLVLDVEMTKGSRYILVNVDDGSGACVEVKIELTAHAGERDGRPERSLHPRTDIEAVSVRISLGLPEVYVNNAAVEIGSVIKVKGRLDAFRGMRQVQVKRMWIVADTNEEAKAWAEVAQWKRNVLSTPWVLTTQERDRFDEKMRLDALKERDRAKRKKTWNAEQAQRRQRRLDKEEKRRRREEQKLNEGALVNSDVVHAPWD